MGFPGVAGKDGLRGIPGRPGEKGTKGEQGLSMVGPPGPKGKIFFKSLVLAHYFWFAQVYMFFIDLCVKSALTRVYIRALYFVFHPFTFYSIFQIQTSSII